VIPLNGEWKGKVAVDGRPPQPLPVAFENLPSMPGVLYNGMLAPLAPLAITGAIWYQGESNTERAYQYRKLMPALIADWRKLFGQGDFPFYIVGLPAYTHRRDVPGDDSWAELREAQALTAKYTPHSCLAIAVDTGDPDNSDAVIVSSRSVPDPKAVRYAWQSNPAATLLNGAGLPASPFRTDERPGITEGHR
jgi:sialate O-acetylesterase